MAAVTRAFNSGLTNVLSLTTADTVAVDRPLASDYLSDELAAMSRSLHDLLNRHTVFARARMAASMSSRRRKPSYWSRSAEVSSLGLITLAPIAAGIGRMDLRTASRKAVLAFSIRCQRSATWTTCRLTVALLELPHSSGNYGSGQGKTLIGLPKAS